MVRAHHSDVGGKVPGSMGLCETIEDEGIRIIPAYLYKKGILQEVFLEALLKEMRNPYERNGDFKAMISSLDRGELRIQELLLRYGKETLLSAIGKLKNYTERAFLELLMGMQKGNFTFTDYLDGDGFEASDIPIKVRVEITSEGVLCDFSESPPTN